eukprot:526750_1
MLWSLFMVYGFLSCYIPAQSIPENTALILEKCGTLPYSKFKATNTSSGYQLSIIGYEESCISCGNNCNAIQQSGNPPPQVTAQNCNSKNSNTNQLWNLVSIQSKSVSFQSVANTSNCIQVIGEYYTMMAKCNKSNINQQFIINSPSNEYISTEYNSSLCFTMGYYNCTISPFKNYAYCNQELPTNQRVDDLISRMNLFEKTQNLGTGQNLGVSRLGVPKNYWAEALHGLRCGCGDTYNNNTGCPTSFPHALLMSASFNRSLWAAVGSAISTEARSFAN